MHGNLPESFAAGGGECYHAPMRDYTDQLTDHKKKGISDFEFFNCGMEQCVPGHSYGPKRRDYHFIHFVVGGQGTLEIRGRTYPVHADQLFVVPAEEVSFYQASGTDPWRYCWVGFLGIESAWLLDTLMRCGPLRYVLDCPRASWYEERIVEILDLPGRGVSRHLRANGALYSLIGTLLEELGADDPKDYGVSIPHQARQYMELHYHDSIQIAEVASAVGVHASYLASAFREEYGMAPKKYLAGLKARKAQELLLQTDLPIYIVASSVGFADPLAFSKFFHRTTGMSPTEFRLRGGRTDEHD